MFLPTLALSVTLALSPPEGFHISWAKSGGVYISWANVGPGNGTQEPWCEVSKDNGSWQRFMAVSTTYNDKCEGPVCTSWEGWLRTAELPADYAQTESFNYTCGDADGMSHTFTAKGRKEPSVDTPKHFILLADIGANENASALSTYLSGDGSDVRKRADFALLIGDIAYANGNQSIWDDFCRLWEPLLSSLPGLFSPGNHDGDWVYGNNYNLPESAWVGGGESGMAYSKRFPGPGPAVRFESPHPNVGAMESTAYWWATQYGGMYMIATSSVHDFEEGSPQYAWLEAELAKANTAESRSAYPWVIVTNHFPMYCTIDDCFCGNYTAAARKQLCEPGRDGKNIPGILEINAVRIKDAFEGLLLTHKVDLFLAGHEHAYERTKPVANLIVPDSCKDSTSVFKDPGAPLHVMAGTGGGSPDSKWRDKNAFSWSVTRSDDSFDDTTPYGLVEFTLSEGNTNLTGVYTNIAKGVRVVKDTFTLLKTL